MMVNVITINYNLSSDSIACVKSLLASEYQDFKIFLIDNGSELSDYQKLLDEFGNNSRIQVLRIDKNCGYVRGINHGLKKAIESKPEFILIMNNDTIIDKSAIGNLVDVARRYDNKAIISGKVYYYDHPDILQHTGVVFKDHRYLTTTYPGKNEKDTGQYDIELERDSLDDIFWLLPIKIIEDVGYYSDYFYIYAEQGDYAQRARRMGYKLIYTPTAKILHKESMTTGAGNVNALPIYYWRGQGMFIFQYRNLKRKYFYRLIIKNFIKYFTKSLFYKKNERRSSFATLRGYFYGLRWTFTKRTNDGYNPYIRNKIR